MASCDDVVISLNNIADKLALNSQVSSPVDLPIGHCEKGEYSESQVTVTVPNNLHEPFIYLFTVLQKLQKDVCAFEPIAGVPEWWQLRPEAQRPQLIIFFAKMRKNGTLMQAKYDFKIPHYPNKKPDVSPIPAFTKGSYMGMALLSDNSKITMYCKDLEEAQGVIGAAKTDLSPEIIGEGLERYGPTRGYGFEEVMLYPKYCKYYSKGLRNVNPDWTVYF